jgi:hypothetical protein
MTAEEWTAFVKFAKKEYGVTNSTLAKVLGIHRVSVKTWQKTGTPDSIGLAVAAVVAGLDPWKP